MARYFLMIAWLFSSVSIISCSDKKAIDFGTFEAGSYTNTFFDLMLSIPKSWHVLDLESRMEIMKRGGEIVAGGNKRLKAALNAADLQSINLLTVYEHPPGAAVATNPGIMLIAEKVTHAPGIKRGSDYHYHAKKLMKLSRMKVSYPKEIYEKTIDGVTFDIMETEITMGPGVVIRQRQYATIMKGYALMMALTYQDESGLNQLEKIVATLTFK
ncbi:MAG: hypothetical protein PVJ44_10950 [Desulfobacterales bacterium]